MFKVCQTYHKCINKQIIENDFFLNFVTLVTGGASGLGRGTVKRFARKGTVIICDLPTSKGAEIAKEIGENVQFIPADITSESEIQNLVDEIFKEYGKLNVLVNCAGLSDSHLTYNFNTDRSKLLEDFRNVLEADEDGLRGIIINTSGMEAFNGTLGQTSIAAASGAIHSMTKPLASDLGRRVIRVVTIVVVIKSPLNNNYFLKEHIFGDADEFAHLVQSIVQNPYINGTTIKLPQRWTVKG